jgi:hypothetical protein
MLVDDLCHATQLIHHFHGLFVKLNSLAMPWIERTRACTLYEGGVINERTRTQNSSILYSSNSQSTPNRPFSNTKVLRLSIYRCLS